MSNLSDLEQLKFNGLVKEHHRIAMRLLECESKSRTVYDSDDERRKLNDEIESLHRRKNEIDEELLPLGEKMDGAEKPESSDRAHVSDKLAYLNQAAANFWRNADRDDPTTHINNATVAAWLIKHGFSETLANKAATIIRPEWAATGRKPEK